MDKLAAMKEELQALYVKSSQLTKLLKEQPEIAKEIADSALARRG